MNLAYPILVCAIWGLPVAVSSADSRYIIILVSVGGADHCIPQCNHLTLFGSAVSVVEFPPANSCVVCFTGYTSGEVVSLFEDSGSVLQRQL